MSEERFEAWLKEHAADYHRPPAEVPRNEMWDAITRTRAARPAPVAGHIGSRISPVRYAIAASLLIGAGIGLGYWMRGPDAVTPAVVASLPAATDSAIRSATYDVASVQHLTAVEALLTSFRKDERAESDVAMRRWARDLLASTRLLMDSPAGEVASRRQLLEDLEYVLAQIVQLDPNAPAEDRAMVDRAINREQVLTRIRSTIPAGFPSGT
ncbi:MAG TPA: hypothetical protein VIK50_16110 [Gemmatimonadaceae bacterium]